MDPCCIICSESFVGCKDIYSTKCGHYSHRSCLTTWLNKAKTCPECRASCTSRDIFKIFFTFDSETTGIALNVKIDKHREEIDQISRKLDAVNSTQESQNQDNKQQIQLIQKQLKEYLASDQKSKQLLQKKIDKLEKRNLMKKSPEVNFDALLYLIIVVAVFISYYMWFK